MASGLADDADIPTADRTHQLLAIQNAVVISVAGFQAAAKALDLRPAKKLPFTVDKIGIM